MPAQLRRLLLNVARDLVLMSLSAQTRRKAEPIFGIIDAKLRHAYRTGGDGNSVEAIIRQSVYEVTRQRASDVDVAGLISLFDPTRLPRA